MVSKISTEMQTGPRLETVASVYFLISCIHPLPSAQTVSGLKTMEIRESYESPQFPTVDPTVLWRVLY